MPPSLPWGINLTSPHTRTTNRLSDWDELRWAFSVFIGKVIPLRPQKEKNLPCQYADVANYSQSPSVSKPVKVLTILIYWHLSIVARLAKLLLPISISKATCVEINTNSLAPKDINCTYEEKVCLHLLGRHHLPPSSSLVWYSAL